MRILLLCHAFNSLSQRVHVELRRRGHAVAVTLDVNDEHTEAAVERFAPELVVAPFLKRAIPASVWRRHTCLILHPGPPGDRGPAALDWAILAGDAVGGVTVLEAVEELDAGPVWAAAEFPLTDPALLEAGKSTLYRQRVTPLGARALLEAVDRLDQGAGPLTPRNAHPGRGWRGAVPADLRRVDWVRQGTDELLRIFRAAESVPGVRDDCFGRPWRLFGAHREGTLTGPPGAFLARRDGAVCRASADGAVWITHARPLDDPDTAFKLPATEAFGAHLPALPESEAPLAAEPAAPTWRELAYREARGIGYLAFEFYNGAMSTAQCERLLAAFRYAQGRPTRAIVLLGGRDFWSNGLHLNCIEAAASPADEAWRNINAMDDLAEAIITTTDRLTVAALRGNAGAGGVFLALAADRVLARGNVVLNPHYRSMGNLYGSEYWTYLLPRRLGTERAHALVDRRLPLGADEARELGLLDDLFAGEEAAFEAWLGETVEAAVAGDRLARFAAAKAERRARDEAERPLADYRRAELEHMRLNFYGFDPSFHVARHRFVRKDPKAWTPRYLAEEVRA